MLPKGGVEGGFERPDHYLNIPLIHERDVFYYTTTRESKEYIK